MLTLIGRRLTLLHCGRERGSSCLGSTQTSRLLLEVLPVGIEPSTHLLSSMKISGSTTQTPKGEISVCLQSSQAYENHHHSLALHHLRSTLQGCKEMRNLGELLAPWDLRALRRWEPQWPCKRGCAPDRIAVGRAEHQVWLLTELKGWPVGSSGMQKNSCGYFPG